MKKLVNKAKRLAKSSGDTFYVIVTEDGSYAVVNSEELDTFFCATPDRDILYCTEE